MAEYTGINMVVEYNSTEISGQGTKVRINPSVGEPKEYDVTHAGDSQDEVLEGLPGAAKTEAEFAAYDESGGSAALLGFDVGDKYDLVVYPEGKTQGNPMITLSDATLLTRPQNIEFGAPVELEATFKSSSKETRTTYSTA